MLRVRRRAKDLSLAPPRPLAGRPQQRLRDIASNDNSHSRDHQIYPDHQPKRPGSSDRPVHQSTPARMRSQMPLANVQPRPVIMSRELRQLNQRIVAHIPPRKSAAAISRRRRVRKTLFRESSHYCVLLSGSHPDAAALEVAIRHRWRARHCSTLRRCTMRSLTSVMP
jgi:hypothetical protein